MPIVDFEQYRRTRMLLQQQQRLPTDFARPDRESLIAQAVRQDSELERLENLAALWSAVLTVTFVVLLSLWPALRYVA